MVLNMTQMEISKHRLTFQRALPQDVQHGQKVSSLEQAPQCQMQLWLLKPGREQNMEWTGSVTAQNSH